MGVPLHAVVRDQEQNPLPKEERQQQTKPEFWQVRKKE
jgi:hypothetical protein